MNLVKTYLFTGLLLLVFCMDAVQSQSNSVDSLEILLEKSEGLRRTEVLAELAKELHRVYPEQAELFASEGLDLLEVASVSDPALKLELLYQKALAHYYKHELDTAMQLGRKIHALGMGVEYGGYQAKGGFLIGRILRDRGKFDYAIATLDSAITYAEIGAEPEFRGQLFNEIGSVHRRKGEIQQALEYHQQALALFKEIDHKSGMASTLGYLGIGNDILGHYDSALNYHQQSLAIRNAMNDPRGAAASLTNIGILNQKIERYDEAMTFYQRALAVWEKLRLQDERASTINNMGAVQELMGNNDQALTYYQEAYEIWKPLGNPYDISISLLNIGNIRMYQGEYDVALDLLKQSLELRLQLGDQTGSSSTLGSIATLYQELGQPDSALHAAQRSLELASQTGSWYSIQHAHETLSELYEKSGQFEDALHHYKQFKAARDTLFNAESQSSIAEMQERYRTREQQQQIELLQQDQKMRDLWLGILIGGFGLSMVVLGLLYNRYLLKRRAHDALQQLHQNEIEKASLRMQAAQASSKLLKAENERKTEELEVARQLQLSMLPAGIPQLEHASIAAYMKPAYEVGGDYYDFDLSREGDLTICIGDGTGHGTKAGTLVTATKSLFNLISCEEDLTDFIKKSSLAIKKMKLPNLYMALALARLRGQTLELVGGGMPPALIYRASSQEVESVDLKGMPLGSVVDYPYQKTTVTLREKDVVLFFSDGFPELKNPDGEMLGYDSIPELLKAAGDRTAESIIKHFRKAGSEWISEKEQEDDITFIVMKMK